MTDKQQDGTGFGMAFGSCEEAKKLIGTKTEIRRGEVDVNWPMIKTFCMLAEDGNPSYWSEEYANMQWGGIISPPALMQTWTAQLQWRPSGVSEQKSLVFSIPLPGNKVINVSTEFEYYRPIKIGEHISNQEELTGVSDLKKSALGVGHFITTENIYTTESGETVAKGTNTMFRFSTEKD